MKKREAVVVEEATEVESPEKEPLPVVEEAGGHGEPPLPEEEPELPYRLGQWGGFTQWACRLCPWDTLESEAAFWAHWQARHGPPPPPAPIIQVYDAGGRPVQR